MWAKTRSLPLPPLFFIVCVYAGHRTIGFSLLVSVTKLALKLQPVLLSLPPISQGILGWQVGTTALGFFTEFPGIKLRSSGSFTHWAISLAPLFVFLSMSYEVWAQTVFKLPMYWGWACALCLFLPPECWDYRPTPSHPATILFQTDLICIMANANCSPL